MNTEITETSSSWLFYDGDCSVCSAWIVRVRGVLLRHGVHPVPLQAPWVGPFLGFTREQLLAEMKLKTADGRIYGGADAFIYLAHLVWWAWPFFWLAQLPGVKPMLRAAYRFIAKRRHCLSGRCALYHQPAHDVRHGASSFYEWP